MVREDAGSGLAATGRQLSENFTSVQVSAEIVMWPCQCACCAVPLPPPPGAKRTKTGLQVVRMSVETFAPFLCTTCTNHVALQADTLVPAPAPQNQNSNGALWGCGSPILFLALAAPGCAILNPVLAVLLSLVLTAVLIMALDGKLAAKAAERDAAAARLAEESRLQEGMASLGPECVHFKSPVLLEHTGGYLRTFRFRNSQIAVLFTELNEDKIVY